jgi:hypothetical protein
MNGHTLTVRVARHGVRGRIRSANARIPCTFDFVDGVGVVVDPHER